jgi:hypothetical protein
MTRTVLATEGARNRVLIAIKVAHTAIWAFFVGCIFAIPVAGWMRRFELAWVLSRAVLVECAALAVNRGRCPLTPVAANLLSDKQRQPSSRLSFRSPIIKSE